MTALALHLPEERSLSRWTFAALAILFTHVAVVAAIALWYARHPVEPNIIPAISVSLASVDASSPEIQTQDIAVGPAMQQAEEVPKEQPKEEKPVEKSEELPLQPEAEVTLPREEPKEIEKPKVAVQPPAPETRAPPKTERIGQFSQASANAYNALVFGHMQRFKRYPLSARGASGTAVVRFELNRAGEVINAAVTRSSGNNVLDEAALDLFRRASPFPAFPAAKPGSQDSFIAPVNFSR
jgi:periplasmic protein TonB